jgi:membrane protein YqaA with SNARE-associated domain
MLHDLAAWMVAWASSPYAGFALFGFAFIESIFFPVPPDPLLITLSVATPSNALIFAGICTVASVFGGITGYYVGLKGGRPLVLRMFGEEKVSYVQHLFQNYDVWAIAIAGFTPIPYKVFTLSAGVTLIDPKRFIIASIIGRAGRFFLVASLIFLFGETIQRYLIEYFDVAALLFAVLLIGGFVVIGLLQRHHSRSTKSSSTSSKPD